MKQTIALAACLGLLSASVPKDADAVAAVFITQEARQRALIALGGALSAAGGSMAAFGGANVIALFGGSVAVVSSGAVLLVLGIIVLPANGRLSYAPLNASDGAELELTAQQVACYNQHQPTISAVADEYVPGFVSTEAELAAEQRRSAEFWESTFNAYETSAGENDSNCSGIQTAYPALEKISENQLRQLLKA